MLGMQLTGQRPLGRTGQYVSNQSLTLAVPGGEQLSLPVVGPLCRQAQLLLAVQELAMLGLQDGQRAVITPQGPRGKLELAVQVTALKPQLLLSPEATLRYGTSDGGYLNLQTFTRTPCLLRRVQVRVCEQVQPVALLTGMEAAECGLQPGDLGRIVL